MDLAAPITEVKGIGPKTAAQLQKADIKIIRDLLYHLPRDYESYQNSVSIASLEPGKVTLRAQISDIHSRYKRRGLCITEAKLSDASGSVRAIWFNQPYRANQFKAHQFYIFSGTLELNYGKYSIMNPSAKLADDNTVSAHDDSSIEPIYPARGGIKSLDYKKFIQKLKTEFYTIPDLLPESLAFSVQGLSQRADALYRVHFPSNLGDSQAGRAYLATEELFTLLLAAKLNKEANARLKAQKINFIPSKLQAIISRLKFKMTDAQRQALWEIIQDLGRDRPMNRLLQGDVGAGKTLVAALAGYVNCLDGHQSVLLAPTEVLATQHATSLKQLFGQDLRVALLTSSTKNKDQLKRQIKAGAIDFIVGTHAVLTDDLGFKDLSLAIIDEQQRFGVRQRQKLLTKAQKMPHLLSMTATPIPRSLQLTIFGDLDVSILSQLPSGRKAIKTQIISPNSTAPMWGHVLKQLDAGRQAYYVCKMIEDSASSDATSVESAAQHLRRRFPAYRIAALHGKMPAARKDEIMQAFKAHQIDILVGTTVIEVGIDVPNASTIIIADADKYGLSQLHQLRGRVGRGEHQSYCYLINSNSSQPSARLREIAKSNDGFYLAEADLRFRGPGEIYGELQHGALSLRIASITDTKLIHLASKLADRFISEKLQLNDYPELAAAVKHYQRLTSLN